MKAWMFVLPLLCGMLAAHLAWTEPASPKGGKGPMQRDRRGGDERTLELLQQVMVARLSQELALDDAQTVLIVRRFMGYQQEMREARRERAKNLRDLREALRTNAAPEQAEAKLSALIAFDQQMAALRETHFKAMSVDLTPWQQGRLYIFLSEFENELRQMLQRAKEHTAQAGKRPMRGPVRKPGPHPGQSGPSAETDDAPSAEDTAVSAGTTDTPSEQ